MEAQKKILNFKKSISESKVELNVEPEFNGKSVTASETGGVYRSLTPKVRREILNRDRCCQFRDSLTGRECGSTFKKEAQLRFV